MLNRRSFVALPFVLAACKTKAEVLNFAGQTMGTTYGVTLVDHTGKLTTADVTRAIDASLAETNASLSNWDAGSDVSRFNAAATTAPIQVTQPLYDVAKSADEIRRISGGSFDAGMGPLIEAWGFGATGTKGVTPSDAEITLAMAKTGQAGAMGFGAGTLQKANAEQGLFLSAIGKGYGVDHVARALKGLGVEDFMVEIGGDLYAAGRNPDGLPWQIGIETPEAMSGLQGVVGLKGHGMATSGDYRNYFDVDGTRYSHIIDGATGRPVTHATASATVIADNAMLADAWATAMLVLGSVKGLEIADANGLAVYFIDRAEDGAGYNVSASASFDTLVS